MCQGPPLLARILLYSRRRVKRIWEGGGGRDQIGTFQNTSAPFRAEEVLSSSGSDVHNTGGGDSATGWVAEFTVHFLAPLTNATRTARLGAMPTVPTVLAGIAGISAPTGRE
jgi:hypothetical protein